MWNLICKLLRSFLAVLILFSVLDSAFSYKYKSAPECPQEPNQVWLLDNANNCHKVNTQGPCGENMLFFPHPNRVDSLQFRGFCDCFDARMETEEEIELINNREFNCLKDVRSQIFVPQRNRCYSAFDQGPCPFGKWLVLNETFYPVCAKNQCGSTKSGKEVISSETTALSTRFKFAHSAKDKCYETNTRGYCPKLYRLKFSPNDWVPKCRYSPSSQSSKKCPVKQRTQTVLRSRCKPGTRRDYFSKCTKNVNPR